MIRFLRSFGHALKGVAVFFSTERNGKLQAFAAICAITLGFVLRISLVEWMMVTGCIGAVISLEMVNTSIEKLCNISFDGFHREVKLIKDIAAGAVLIAAIASLVIGLIIFVPKILLK